MKVNTHRKTKKITNKLYIMKQTFLEFNNDLRGFNVHSKTTNANIPRYQLYWFGFTFFEIKSRFNLIKRER